MNPNLKRQLKAVYEPPKPKRKQEFLQQIQPLIVKKQNSFVAFPLFHQKWVWVTSFSIILIIGSIFVKVPTVEYDTEETMYCNHIWVYNDQERITETKDYVYLKCMNCGMLKKTIKQISFSKEEFYLVEEDAP